MDSASAGEPQTFRVFGYGSLALPDTHRTRALRIAPATLRGWRRRWMVRPDMPGFASALLSVEEDVASQIDGLVIENGIDTLPELDRREKNYERRPLARESLDIRSPEAWSDVVIYKALPISGPTVRLPILRSYLDVVFLGFHRLGGMDAVMRFIDSTDGWACGIRDDRAAPIYPRAQVIDTELLGAFDKLLAARLRSDV